MISTCANRAGRRVVRARTCVLAVLLGLGIQSVFAAPVILYTDVIAAPNTGGANGKGAFVTLYGQGFGTSTGSVTVGGAAADNYPVWTDTKVTVQLGTGAKTGSIVLTSGSSASNGVPFTVRSGNVYFVDANSKGNPGSGTFADPWRSPANAYSSVKGNDFVYFRAGTYTGHYGGSWGNSSFDLGVAQSNTSWIGYPGETAKFVAPIGAQVFKLYNGESGSGGAPAWPTGVVIANLVMDGNGTGPVDSGSLFPPTDKGGAPNVRVVGNDVSSSNSLGVFYSLINPSSNNWSVLGNYIHNAGILPVNLNQAIYVQNGASNVEIAWNKFNNLYLRYAIMVHGDHQYEYDNVNIHDNEIVNTGNIDDFRGIAVGGALAGTYGSIYNNVIVNVGQSFGAININNGTWSVYNNTIYNVSGGGGGAIQVNGASNLLSSGSQPKVTVRNNIIDVGNTGTAYVVGGYNLPSANLIIDSNLYYGNGNGPSADAHAVNVDPKFSSSAIGTGNYHLQSSSPAIDKGAATVASVVLLDHDGQPRPQGTGFDLGAFEFTNAAPRPLAPILSVK